MRRVALCAFVLAAMAAGCRGVLGIEPLEVASDASTEDGSKASTDAAQTSDSPSTTDTGAKDGGARDADAGAPDVADASQNYAACVSQGSQCRPCCKTTYAAATQLLLSEMVEAGCICGSGQCGEADACATSVCADSPQPPPGSCAMCTDDAVLPPQGTQPTPQCGHAIDGCKDDPSCMNAIECLQACPGQ